MKIESYLENIKNNTIPNQNNNKELKNSNFDKLLNEGNLKITSAQLDNDNSKLSQKQFENLINKLDLKGLSQKEKELYKSIIEDGYISNKEIKDLSYEEVKTLGKFVFKKDDSGEYIDETLINSDLKAGTLLSTAVISDNEDFNKSVFKMVEKLEKDEDITSFMYLITGTFHSNKLIAFPELQEIKYEGKDIKELLEDRISTFEGMLEVSASAELSKTLKSVINQFEDLLNIFDNISKGEKQSSSKSSYNVDITQELIDDLMSMMETGLTKTEIEALEKLITQIKNKIEDSKEEKVAEEEIEELLKELENKIKEIKQRVTGDDTVEVNKESKNIDKEGLSIKMQEFKSMVQSLEKTLEKVQEEANKATAFTSSHEELMLREQFSKN